MSSSQSSTTNDTGQATPDDAPATENGAGATESARESILLVDEDDDEDEDDGQKLRELLGKERRSQAELAEAAGVTRTAVQRWLKTPHFSDKMWNRIEPALRRLRMDPREIRPAGGQATKGATQDLKQLVQDWSDENLATMRKVLRADEPSRERLLDYIDGALRKIP